MPMLNEDLSAFARSIVRGEETSSKITASYQNYSLAIVIEVYRNNYRGNLHDMLAGAYPVIEQLVGKDFFKQMTRKFIGQHFSCSGNLHQYGSQMASFIESYELAKGLAYLPDVALLEWACHCAYFAEDAAALDITKLAQVPPEQYPELILHVHPACWVGTSNYPIVAIWHAHQPGAPCDFHIDLDSGPCNALVSRKENVVLVSALSDADAAWLHSIKAGIPLGTATDTTLERYPDFELQSALLYLLQAGILIDI